MMLIVDGDKPSYSMVGRYVELHYLLQAHKNHAVAFIEHASLAKMKKDETLFILGHGDLDTIGEAWSLTPAELAGALLSKGLGDTHIVLGSCSGGVRDILRGTSYFEELVKELWNQAAIKAWGEAYTGATSITPAGTYAVQDPALYNLFQHQAYLQILSNGAFELNCAVKLIGMLRRKKYTDAQIAALVTEVTDNTFQNLFTHNHNLRKTAGEKQIIRAA